MKNTIRDVNMQTTKSYKSIPPMLTTTNSGIKLLIKPSSEYFTFNLLLPLPLLPLLPELGSPFFEVFVPEERFLPGIPEIMFKKLKRSIDAAITGILSFPPAENIPSSEKNAKANGFVPVEHADM